jgi:DNA processing protein
MRDDLVAWLRLTLSPGVFEPWQRALLREFGTPARAVAAPLSGALDVVPRHVAEGLQQGPSAETLERTLRWLDQPGHRLVALGDPDYPRMLLQIADPPTVLYVIGRTDLLNAPGLAIVGSRNASPRGMQDAQAFAHALSDAGLAIVSGLALGIDAEAHRGGLAGASSSLAVLGTGADVIYPKRNAELAARLAQEGALITEFPIGTPPVRENFPRRNRLISGLARGVLVVEAALPSGSLVTAKAAIEQNREVFAIPGSIHSPFSRGCHHLIRQGAKLVETTADVLEELRMPAGAPSIAEPAKLPREQAALLAAMGAAPVTIDQLAAATRRSAAEVAACISVLEIAGVIASAAGGRFQRLHDPVIE